MRVCSTPGCPEIYPTTQGTRCHTHRGIADRGRGTATQRGYTGRGHQTFRNTVLTRHPICQACQVALSTVADHYPKSRKELIELNLNPNDPQHGRGLCTPCHSKETAHHQPGGWNQA